MPQIFLSGSPKIQVNITMCKNRRTYLHTKNGYGDMVIMSMEVYKKKMFMLDVYDRLLAAEEQIKSGKTLDADASIKSIREKFDV